MTLRRTALARRTELARGAPLRRRKAMVKVAAAKRTVAKQRAARDTGPTTSVKQLVWFRAHSRCEVCGVPIAEQPHGWSLHHRQPRGMGGTRRPDVNEPANLLLLCGSGTTGCHGVVESQRAIAYAHGWLLRTPDSPAEIPVHLHTGRVVYLTSEGEYAEGAP